MDSLGLSLNSKSSAALREFAEAMPLAVDNIVNATMKVLQIYQSVQDTLGVHRDSFYDLLVNIKNAQESAAEAIEVLPQMLISTADKIDAYVAHTPSV